MNETQDLRNVLKQSASEINLTSWEHANEYAEISTVSLISIALFRSRRHFSLARYHIQTQTCFWQSICANNLLFTLLDYEISLMYSRHGSTNTCFASGMWFTNSLKKLTLISSLFPWCFVHKGDLERFLFASAFIPSVLIPAWLCDQLCFCPCNQRWIWNTLTWSYLYFTSALGWVRLCEITRPHRVGTLFGLHLSCIQRIYLPTSGLFEYFDINRHGCCFVDCP